MWFRIGLVVVLHIFRQIKCAFDEIVASLLFLAALSNLLSIFTFYSCIPESTKFTVTFIVLSILLRERIEGSLLKVLNFWIMAKGGLAVFMQIKDPEDQWRFFKDLSHTFCGWLMSPWSWILQDCGAECLILWCCFLKSL